MDKQLILQKIEIVEQNIRRFKTLVEVDFDNNDQVPLYCLLKAQIEIKDLILERSNPKLIE